MRKLTVFALLAALTGAGAGYAASPAAAQPACTITGTMGPDVLIGTAGPDRICGLGGNDRLFGEGGWDTLLGGPGDDVLSGGPDSDTLNGGEGNDTHNGGAGFDRFESAQAGSDTFNGGPDTDTVDYRTVTAPVVVSIDGVANDGLTNERDNVATDVENIDAGGGNDTLLGSSVANVFTGFGGNDSMFGGGGDDWLFGMDGDDYMSGEAGNDWLVGGPGADTHAGGTGTDSAYYNERNNNITVTIDGLSDDGEVGERDSVNVDVEDVYAGDGNDTLIGSSANNRLQGYDGNDTIEGRGGNDSLWGGGHADTLRGGDGSDALDGSWHGDTLSGGSGFDHVTYAYRTAEVYVWMDGIANDGESGEGDNIESDVEQVSGGAGFDWMVGNVLANHFVGNGGDDTLQGGGGNDSLEGGRGDDALYGQGGSDRLFPGLEADWVAGGTETDSVFYTDRVNSVRVSLDGTSNDGEPGEGDYVESDVENLFGGSGNDLLTGNGSANTLDGSLGIDRLQGMGGNDTLLARDYESDTLEGGAGVDRAQIDPEFDRLDSVESTF